MTASPESDKHAVVLLSGGLDSATTAAIARDAGYCLHALSVDYGQRHRFELDAARRVAAALEVEAHKIMSIDLSAFGGSALTDKIQVPQGRTDSQIATGIPITYVPARNTVMLSLALAYAELIPAADIFIGVNAVDFSGYPDCRPAFITAFEQLANLATKAGVEVSSVIGLRTASCCGRRSRPMDHRKTKCIGRTATHLPRPAPTGSASTPSSDPTDCCASTLTAIRSGIET